MLALPALAAIRAVPVLVGKVAGLDACATLGEVSGLDPQGYGFLAVRTGPGSAHALVDKLSEERRVFVCDERGAWTGIVYSNDPGDIDCGVGSPLEAPEPYAGACRSGWVNPGWIKAVGG